MPEESSGVSTILGFSSAFSTLSIFISNLCHVAGGLDNVAVVSPKDTIICTVKSTRNMTQVANENTEGAEGAAEA